MTGEDRLTHLARRIWYSDREDLTGGERALLALLVPAEAAYRLGAAGHSAFSRLRRGRPLKTAAPVVSVGNLTVGGSGKSTFCLFLAEEVRKRGRRAALVSHSYGAPNAGCSPLVFRGSEGLVPGWEEGGDEAVMSALLAPDLIVASGRDKRESLRAASEAGEAMNIMEDDIHRRDIQRDLDLVLVDAGRGLGNGRCLPRGPLREPPGALDRADAVIITRIGEGGADFLKGVLRGLSPGITILTAGEVLRGISAWPGGGEIPPGDLRGRPVFAFCGVGNPGSFMNSVSSLGAEIRGKALFGDHHPYTPEDIKELVRESRLSGAGLLVTTAKDAVKIKEWPGDAPPLAVIRNGFVLDDPGGWLDGKLGEILAP